MSRRSIKNKFKFCLIFIPTFTVMYTLFDIIFKDFQAEKIYDNFISGIFTAFLYLIFDYFINRFSEKE